MNSKNYRSLAPKFRFSGFEGEWKENRLGEVVTSFSGGTPKSGAADYYGGSIPFIRSGEIHKTETELFITKEGLKNSSAKLVKKGDLLYALYGATSGEVAISKIDGAINQAILCIRSNKIDISFLRHFLESKKDFITSRYLQGGQGNLSSEIILSLIIPFPSICEQKKIAESLTLFDEIISSQRQKIESLKAHKKGLMQQLFPQNGETTPRLRFPGFTEEWKEKTFSDLCNTVTPPLKLQSRDYLKEGKYPIVDQSQDLICGWTNDEKGVVSENPVIIFGDHTCVLKYIDFPFVQGADGVKILKPREGYCGQFLFQSFLANPVNPDGYKRHFSDLKEKSLMFPKTFSEQQIIAECLSTLDTIIAEETSKTEGLKAYKKGLMQQLFPIYK